MAKQYRLHSYNSQPKVGDADGEGAHQLMEQMTADGWTVHTANVQWPEATILWERDAPEEDGDDTGPEAGSKAESKPKSKPAGRRAGAPSG